MLNLAGGGKYQEAAKRSLPLALDAAPVLGAAPVMETGDWQSYTY